jgi:hypothetical protein
LLKTFKIIKNSEKYNSTKQENFSTRIKRFKDEYNESCLMLSEGRPSELEIVKRLSVYDFEIMFKHKQESHARTTE